MRTQALALAIRGDDRCSAIDDPLSSSSIFHEVSKQFPPVSICEMGKNGTRYALMNTLAIKALLSRQDYSLPHVQCEACSLKTCPTLLLFSPFHTSKLVETALIPHGKGSSQQMMVYSCYISFYKKYKDTKEIFI